MPYNEQLDPWGGGYSTRDILAETPGYAGPLQKGAEALENERRILYGGIFGTKGKEISPEVYEKAKQENPLLVGAGELLGLVKPESQARKGGIESWVSRGVYLIVGTVLLIFGLVILSRPAREGIAEGIAEGVREALEEK